MLAKDVFILAMTLMDEESQDGTFTGYPDEYKKKSWNILTLLQTELLHANIDPLPVINESTPIQIDNRTATTVLPYGLAAHLLMNEDQARASFFNARYDELKRKRPAIRTSIKDVYGIKTKEPQPDDPTLGSIDGGSFFDGDSGVYDGGEF